MRSVTPSRPAAGYFVLRNDSGSTVALVGASSPDCGMLMLHQSVRQGGQDQMKLIDRVDVPAHGVLRFAPGGFHLMCASPDAAVHVRNRVPVTLRLADGRAIGAMFAVKGPGGQ